MLSTAGDGGGMFSGITHHPGALGEYLLNQNVGLDEKNPTVSESWRSVDTGSRYYKKNCGREKSCQI